MTTEEIIGVPFAERFKQVAQEEEITNDDVVKFFKSRGEDTCQRLCEILDGTFEVNPEEMFQKKGPGQNLIPSGISPRGMPAINEFFGQYRIRYVDIYDGDDLFTNGDPFYPLSTSSIALFSHYVMHRVRKQQDEFGKPTYGRVLREIIDRKLPKNTDGERNIILKQIKRRLNNETQRTADPTPYALPILLQPFDAKPAFLVKAEPYDTIAYKETQYRHAYLYGNETYVKRCLIDLRQILDPLKVPPSFALPSAIKELSRWKGALEGRLMALQREGPYCSRESADEQLKQELRGTLLYEHLFPSRVDK